MVELESKTRQCGSSSEGEAKLMNLSWMGRSVVLDGKQEVELSPSCIFFPFWFPSSLPNPDSMFFCPRLALSFLLPNLEILPRFDYRLSTISFKFSFFLKVLLL